MKLVAAALTVLAMLGASAAPALASADPIVSLRLDRPGYRVVALGYNGQIAVAYGPHVRLTAPDSRFTLQLLAPNGQYAGPVVVGRLGTWVLEGLRHSVDLGLVKVLAGKGYAQPVHAVQHSDIDLTRRAYATSGGAPLGNGLNKGAVKSPGHGPAGPGRDRDRDGVPDLFDVK